MLGCMVFVVGAKSPLYLMTFSVLFNTFRVVNLIGDVDFRRNAVLIDFLQHPRHFTQITVLFTLPLRIKDSYDGIDRRELS